jgi:WD40 repeat protein
LAAIAFFGGLHLVEVATGKEIYKVPDANTVAFSPDDRTLAITKTDGKLATKLMDGMRLTQSAANSWICLLDSITGHEKVRIALPGAEIWALAYAPDGKTLAATTGWKHGQIHFYDTASGKETQTINTPPLRTSALAFTPDGSRIVAGMADTSVLVWSVGPNSE